MYSNFISCPPEMAVGSRSLYGGLFLNVCPFDSTAVAESGRFGP